MPQILLPFATQRANKAEHVPEKYQMGDGKRIPDTLKAVILASNAGKDVEVIKAPPARVASKTYFFRNVAHALGRGSSKHNKSSHSKSSSTECGSVDSFNSSLEQTEPEQTVFEDLIPTMAPQEYLETMMKARGYGVWKFDSLQTGYYNEPTALQLSSYDARIIDLVRKRDLPSLQSLINCGISLNPCNVHGESLIHTICRLGDLELLQLFVHAGAFVQVSDDYGRTPLHNACWTATPCFELIEYMIRLDRHMIFLKDARGSTPLSYIRKEHFGMWVEFLVSKRDTLFPALDIQTKMDEDMPGARCLEEPNSMPLSDPSNALTPRLATMVVSGKIAVDEIEYLRDKCMLNSNGELVDSSSDYSDDYDSSDDDSQYSSDYSESDDEDEEDEICNSEPETQ